MIIDFNTDKPIYIQLMDIIEDAIISGAFPEESQIPSTTEISVINKVNPATALKGINMLVSDGIIYKKRGVGMFVATGAVEKLKQKRKSAFSQTYIETLIEEAKKLNISKQEIITMIDGGYEK